jgi:hypothetical protein
MLIPAKSVPSWYRDFQSDFQPFVLRVIQDQIIGGKSLAILSC